MSRSGAKDAWVRCLLIGALLAAAWAIRGPLEAQRGAIVGDMRQEAARLRPLEGQASSVLLSGLRGPVVVSLWATAENEKTNEQWERLRTRYQMIAALQPHFAKAYEFNAWNLAYNIAAEESDLAQRYDLVLDAVDFLLQGERQIPHSAVINWELQWTFRDKLGNSSEADFYKSHFREQTMPGVVLSPGRQGPGTARHVPLVAADGRLNPAHPYYESLDRIRPVVFEPIDGLDQPAPGPIPAEFPYGVSVFACAYNYAVRARDCGEHPSKPAHMVYTALPTAATMWGEHVEHWADMAAGKLPDALRRTVAGLRAELDALSNGSQAELDRARTLQARLKQAMADLAVADAHEAANRKEALFLYARAGRLAELSLWQNAWLIRVETGRRIPEQIPERMRALGLWASDATHPRPDDPRYPRIWLLPMAVMQDQKLALRNMDRALWRWFRMASAAAELEGWQAARHESREKALAVLRRSATLAAQARQLILSFLGTWLPQAAPRDERSAALLLGESDQYIRRYLEARHVEAAYHKDVLELATAFRETGQRRQRIAAWLGAS